MGEGIEWVGMTAASLWVQGERKMLQARAKVPVIMTKAYLFAEINVISGQTIQVIILSDERPTLRGMERAWALLSVTYGKDYQEAHRKMKQQIESIRYWGWVQQFMQVPW